MGVSLNVDFLCYELGSSDFLHAFFSTIAYHLEPQGWGTQYPVTMKELYRGRLSWKSVPGAKAELSAIRKRLEDCSPDTVVWDIEDPCKPPPWGTNISSHITSLANYFVTSDGRDLFNVMFVALDEAWKRKNDIEMR